MGLRWDVDALARRALERHALASCVFARRALERHALARHALASCVFARRALERHALARHALASCVFARRAFGRRAFACRAFAPRAFGLSQVLIIDEADRILEIGFEEDMRAIIKALPKAKCGRAHTRPTIIQISNPESLSSIPIPNPYPQSLSSIPIPNLDFESRSPIPIPCPHPESPSQIPNPDPQPRSALRSRQTALFSATQTRNVADLARLAIQHKPVYVQAQAGVAELPRPFRPSSRVSSSASPRTASCYSSPS